jgi:hypothetical protein
LLYILLILNKVLLPLYDQERFFKLFVVLKNQYGKNSRIFSMKAGLKRIEATLHDLGNRSTALATEPTSDSKQRPFSFRISIKAPEAPESPENEQQSSQAEIETIDISINTFGDTSEAILFPQHSSVQTFPTEQTRDKTPILPKFKTPNFSNHRHGANPALAMNILQDIQETIAGWQRELQEILQQIQKIYLEGPIINGWLESHPPETESGGTAMLRHGEVHCLMDYVEEICSHGDKIPHQSPRTDYRLCAVDAAGKPWSRLCPSEQVANVSMAIARYQRLRQLLGRKQYLETRLSQLAENLVVLHSNIQET